MTSTPAYCGSNERTLSRSWQPPAAKRDEHLLALVTAEPDVDAQRRNRAAHHADAEACTLMQCGNVQFGTAGRDPARVGKRGGMQRTPQWNPILCLEQHEVIVTEAQVVHAAQRRRGAVGSNQCVVDAAKHGGASDRSLQVERYVLSGFGVGGRQPRVQRQPVMRQQRAKPMLTFEFEPPEGKPVEFL